MSFSLTQQGGLEDSLSRTPPNFAPSSYEVGHLKRTRAGSISGRLRAASDLEEHGFIDRAQKGVLKDLIITGSDPQLQTALEKYERGDPTEIQGLLQSGHLNRKHSIDLLEDLDLNFLNMNGTQKNEDLTGFELGDFSFDESFDEGAVFNIDNYPFSDVDPTHGHPLSDGAGEVPTAGLGTTPPFPLHFQPDIFSTLDLDQPGFHAGSFGRARGLSFSSPASAGDKKTLGGQGKVHIKTEPGLAAAKEGNGVARSQTFPAAGAQGNRSSYMTSGQRQQQQQQPHVGNGHATTSTPGAASASYFAKPPAPSAAVPIAKPQLQHSQSVDGKEEKKCVGAYSPESRRKRIERYLEKRKRRVWTKKVKYDVRKNFADSRLRVKGRFVKKEDEELLREILNIT